jgi:hypothetical protein
MVHPDVVFVKLDTSSGKGERAPQVGRSVATTDTESEPAGNGHARYHRVSPDRVIDSATIRSRGWFAVSGPTPSEVPSRE